MLRYLLIAMLGAMFGALIACQSPPSTQGSGDATDAVDIVNGDGKALDPCGNCPIAQQPTGNQPGSSTYAETVTVQEVALGAAQRPCLIYTPDGPGPYPVLAFVHGKQLYEGTVAPGQVQLAHVYRPMLEHVARKGYVVVFVRVEQDILDGDHARMADDFLSALQAALALQPKADPTRIAYAGHSMGAKVIVIAGAKATTLDTANAYADPDLLLPMAVENTPPPIGDYVDAREFVKQWPGNTFWVTYLAGQADTIAPYADPTKPNTQALFDLSPAKGKQIILLHGSGPADALNPPTAPTLTADHMFPGAIEGKNGGIADMATPLSHLDALDWYGVWKIVVGALDYHFKKGDSAWIYGDLRTHGGTLPDGTVLRHEVPAEVLPSGL